MWFSIVYSTEWNIVIWRRTCNVIYRYIGLYISLRGVSTKVGSFHNSSSIVLKNHEEKFSLINCGRRLISKRCESRRMKRCGVRQARTWAVEMIRRANERIVNCTANCEKSEVKSIRTAPVFQFSALTVVRRKFEKGAWVVLSLAAYSKTHSRKTNVCVIRFSLLLFPRSLSTFVFRIQNSLQLILWQRNDERTWLLGVRSKSCLK
mgnify:CR=1 FL=1